MLLNSSQVTTNWIPYKATKLTREEIWWGCYSQRFLKFPIFLDVFPNVKFPWPTELTMAQISPDKVLKASLTAWSPAAILILIYAFSKTHAVYMNWLFCNIKCKKDRFSWKPNISLFFNFMNNITWFMSIKCTKCTLKTSLFPVCFQRIKISLTWSEIPWLSPDLEEIFSLTISCPVATMFDI